VTNAATGLKRLGWAVLAVLGLLALAWVGVPPLLKSQIEQHASAALGRRCRSAGSTSSRGRWS